MNPNPYNRKALIRKEVATIERANYTLSAAQQVVSEARNRIEGALERIREVLAAEMPLQGLGPMPDLLEGGLPGVMEFGADNEKERLLWVDEVDRWLRNPVPRAGAEADRPLRSSTRRVYLREVLEHAIGFEPGQATHGDKVRVGKILLRLGWRKRREGKQPHNATREEYWLQPVRQPVEAVAKPDDDTDFNRLVIAWVLRPVPTVDDGSVFRSTPEKVFLPEILIHGLRVPAVDHTLELNNRVATILDEIMGWTKLAGGFWSPSGAESQ